MCFLKLYIRNPVDECSMHKLLLRQGSVINPAIAAGFFYANSESQSGVRYFLCGERRDREIKIAKRGLSRCQISR